jgi:hypothetical protein
MIVVHRNTNFNARRGAMWLAFALAPWGAFYFSGETLAELGGRWGAAALVSPVCLFLGFQEFSRMMKDKGAVLLKEGRISSSTFDHPISELISVADEWRRPLGFQSEKFIVLHFSEGRSEALFAKSVVEDADVISSRLAVPNTTVLDTPQDNQGPRS